MPEVRLVPADRLRAIREEMRDLFHQQTRLITRIDENEPSEVLEEARALAVVIRLLADRYYDSLDSSEGAVTESDLKVIIASYLDPIRTMLRINHHVLKWYPELQDPDWK